MAEAPQTPSPSSTAVPSPAPPAPGRRLVSRILPFIPIALAVGVALAYRHYYYPQPVFKTDADLVGAKAPDFSLRDAHKEPGDPLVTLSLLVEKSPVMLVFYRGYSCPRCMWHLQLVDDQIDEFANAGLQVVAISPDTPANTRDSIDTYNQDFPFPLLYDPDDKVARAYDLPGQDGYYLHGVFVVDMERRIRFAARTQEQYPAILDVVEVGKKLQQQP
jgi:peroxiredoxin